MKGSPTLSIVAIVIAWCLSAVTAFAGSHTPQRVVELFTSQGCSSCPPANKFVKNLSESDPDVLVLSYGVTYWDYLGWKDTFGHKRFTERQGQYRDALKTNMYTPQIVLNGLEDAPKFKTREVHAHSLKETVNLRADRGQLIVTGNLPVGSTLAIVDYTPGTQSVAVKRGENSGRTLTLANVVTGIDYRRWEGMPMSLPMPREGRAVLVHAPRSSEIIAAANYTVLGPA